MFEMILKAIRLNGAVKSCTLQCSESLELFQVTQERARKLLNTSLLVSTVGNII